MLLAVRPILVIFVLVLICLGLRSAALAQDPVITLEIDSPEGPITLGVGSRISRDGESQDLILEGGVQLRRDPDLLIVADKATVAVLPTQEGEPQASGFDTLRLQGQIYAQIDDAEVQADQLTLSRSSYMFLASGDPLILHVAGQALQSDGEMRGDLNARTFIATGGTIAEFYGAKVQAGEMISLTIPPVDQPEVAPTLAAIGSVYLWVEEAEIRAEQIRSDETGTWVYFRGGVEATGPEGRLSADSAWFNLKTRDFALNRAPPDLESGL